MPAPPRQTRCPHQRALQVRSLLARYVRLYERQLSLERRLGSEPGNMFLYALASDQKTRREKGMRLLVEQLHERHIVEQPTLRQQRAHLGVVDPGPSWEPKPPEKPARTHPAILGSASRRSGGPHGTSWGRTAAGRPLVFPSLLRCVASASHTVLTRCAYVHRHLLWGGRPAALESTTERAGWMSGILRCRARCLREVRRALSQRCQICTGITHSSLV